MFYKFTQAIEIFKGLLTPIIAILALYIAWQQWQTNRQKLVLEKYDRMLHIYEEIKKIISIILVHTNPSIQDLGKFKISVSEADFLFGSEITEYIDEIYKRGFNLCRCNGEYRDYEQEKPEGYDHKKIVDERKKELIWFTEQFKNVKEKFKKYLDLSK